MSFIGVGVAGLAAYTYGYVTYLGAATLAVHHDDSRPWNWLCGWGTIILGASYGWYMLYRPQYRDEQIERLSRLMIQDHYLVAFMMALSGVLRRAGMLHRGTMAEPILFLMPPVLLWITTQGKVLIHRRVSSPFHTTWWCDGKMSRFAPSELLNFTFGLVTVLTTAGMTSYALYSVLWVLGIRDVASLSNVIRHGGGGSAADASSMPAMGRFLAWHGIALMWTSGMWMAASSSGLPGLTQGSDPWMNVPPFLPANPHDCIPVHKMDLAVGIAMLLTAAMAPSDSLSFHTNAIQWTVTGTWAISLLWKLRTHIRGIGYKPTPFIKKD